MKICIITCHDVYNVGASLQAYALTRYLIGQGHEVRIIDYKPEYLSRHYRLDVVNNPKYDRPVLKQLYLAAKLCSRIKRLHSRKKQEFDEFKRDYLILTPKRYGSFAELCKDPPEAEIYIAGSDQIWNPLFNNGKDPAFFLQFVRSGKRISYAASFAVSELDKAIADADREYLKQFDAISVREASGISLVEKMGLKAVWVCDPVFLLGKDYWKKLLSHDHLDPYIFVYDFDGSVHIKNAVLYLKKEKNLRIRSFFSSDYADESEETGPIGFLNNLVNADIVISNSFHATAFSLIFHKEFYVFGRKEAINERLKDILFAVGMLDRYITDMNEIESIKKADWSRADARLKVLIDTSKAFLDRAVCRTADEGERT